MSSALLPERQAIVIGNSVLITTLKVEIDDLKQRLSASETITYYNNSPDPLAYRGCNSIRISGRKIQRTFRRWLRQTLIMLPSPPLTI